MILSMLAVTLCSCSLTAMSMEEFKTLYPQAVQNSYAEDLFFWKESTVAKKEVSTRRCNVYAEIDKKYNRILKENGDFANLVVDITENAKSKNVLRILCGDAPSVKGDKLEPYLLKTTYNSKGEEEAKTKTKMTSKEFIASDLFQQNYGIDHMLSELAHLDPEEMDIDVKGGGIIHKGNVVLITFKVNDDYLNRYKTTTGKDSMFVGSVRATIELSYERIASIVVYSNETLDKSFSIETEKYKLEIVYFGPIVKMPQYDETKKDGNKDVPLWQDA